MGIPKRNHADSFETCIDFLADWSGGTELGTNITSQLSTQILPLVLSHLTPTVSAPL